LLSIKKNEEGKSLNKSEWVVIGSRDDRLPMPGRDFLLTRLSPSYIQEKKEEKNRKKEKKKILSPHRACRQMSMPPEGCSF